MFGSALMETEADQNDLYLRIKEISAASGEQRRCRELM